jgi:hypothetical protein
MKKKIFKYAEAIIIVVAAAVVWYLADKIFAQVYLNNWGWLIFASSTFFIFWSLGAMIFRDRRVFLGMTFVALCSQLIFIQEVGIFLIILISFLILSLARWIIRKEIKSRLEVNIWDSLRVGKRLFILTIALMLASQYYFFDTPQIESKNLPKIKIGSEQQGGYMKKIIAMIDADVFDSSGDSLTVNEFVLKKAENKKTDTENKGYLVNNVKLDNFQKEILLESGRGDIAKMAEREVFADEKIVDIFVEILNKKIDDLLNLNVGYINQDIPVMHLVFTLAIFLAVFSAGMMISFIWIFLVKIILLMLVEIGLLSVDKKAVNMEILKIN